MGDAEQDIIPALHRAQRRRRRRARQRVLGVLVTALVLFGAAVTTTGLVSLSKSERAKAASSAEPALSSSSSTTRAVAKHRALTPDEPLKLWIGGDSLAGSLGPALGAMTAATGVVAPQYDSRVSSGLATASFFDWPEHATEQMAELEPEAAVFIIGTNDANFDAEDDPVTYERLTMEMMHLLAAGGRPVYWVNAPVMREDDLEESVQEVNEIQRRAAARFDNVTYLDAHDLFDGDTGEYSSRLPDETGKLVTMRADDGVHLSTEGADLLARLVFTLLDVDWRISEQADPTRPQEVVETEGSTQVTGTYRSTGSSSGSGATGTTPGSSATTVTSAATTTTTAPPATSTTTPPTTTALPPGP